MVTYHVLQTQPTRVTIINQSINQTLFVLLHCYTIVTPTPDVSHTHTHTHSHAQTCIAHTHTHTHTHIHTLSHTQGTGLHSLDLLRYAILLTHSVPLTISPFRAMHFCPPPR